MLIPLGTIASQASVALSLEYLVIAGGGGGGAGTGSSNEPGGGGAGGYRSSVTGEQSGQLSTAETPLTIVRGTNYAVTVGAGGPDSTNGSNSVFDTIISTGGGRGANLGGAAGASGGSGGGGGGYLPTAGGAGTTNQGFDGGTPLANGSGAGGGGAGAAGQGGNTGSAIPANGGVGIESLITGTATFRAGGGAGQVPGVTSLGGLGGGADRGPTGSHGTVNTGGGAAAGGATGTPGGIGGSGIVILRYPATLTITIGAGLTGTSATVGTNKVTTITLGTGNVSWA